MSGGESLPHIVIVGAGFGGLSCARKLRRAPARVTILDKANHHLFQPLLYQVATAGLSPADIATPVRNVVRRQKNTEVLMAEVTGVDPERRLVNLGARQMPYDQLVIATGATHGYFGHEEWASFAPGLKSIEDALLIRRRILLAFEKAELEDNPAKHRALMTFVLVGAGPTGVEMAGSIAELAHVALARDFRHIDPASARVVLLEAGHRILSTFPESLAERAKHALEKLGVEVRVNSRVDGVDAEGAVVSGLRIPSSNVIWTAGVVASNAAKWLSAPPDKAGRVPVGPDLTVAGHPEVFVIGDTAAATEGGKPLPGVAPVAMQQGRYVAGVIERRLRGKTPPPPFHYVDKGNLATIGRAYAVCDFRGVRLSGWFGWVTWLVVHIIYLIGFRNRLIVLIEWAWAYLTFQRGARLITMEPDKGQAHQDKIRN